MSAIVARSNGHLRDGLTAILAGALAWAGLSALHFSPSWLAAATALVVTLLWLVSPDLACVLIGVALALPLFAASPVVAIIFLAAGIACLRYLGSSKGTPLLLVMSALAAAGFGPAWGVAAVAGFLLGPAEGALAAAVAALLVQAYGIAFGLNSAGATFIGASRPLVDLARVPESVLASTWIADSVGRISPSAVDKVMAAVTHSAHPLALLLQPLAWAGCAATAGYAARALRAKGRVGLAPFAAGLGALVAPAAVALLLPAVGVPAKTAGIALPALTSALAALAFAFAYEFAFPRVAEKASATSPTGAPAVADEDADVDELLRLIATAEDKLSHDHTAHKTVMITDMKSFTNMTEEDGSILSAKAIQRHRDLLVPVIERHGGHGKSTGGDGLVAAFDDSRTAASAAAEMLKVLERHNAGHPGQRPLSIRIGLADGEVVLDRRGRPFIGAALNLAARVMALADGGEIFATAEVACAARPMVELHRHGEFSLKNIAQPVEVFELLWKEDRAPRQLLPQLAS